METIVWLSICKLHVRLLRACAAALEQAGIPFTPAVGAIFLWVDLRKWLPEPTWEVM
jgi:hypothetical protein